MTKIPVELKNAIRNNQLLIFVGAGLSYDLVNVHNNPIKGWSNLVGQTLNDLKEKGYDVDHFIALINKCDPVKILDLMESDKKIPRGKINVFLKDFLDLDNENNNLDLHRKLYQLSKKIITTNYDAAFEIAVPELRKNKAHKGKNYEMTTHRDPNSTLLFKLHGCYEDADSMVLFPTDYNNLYNNTDKDAEHAIWAFRNILLNKSILFIGTGMGDFQINNLFKEIEKVQGRYNQNHFIISNKTLDSSLDFLTHIPADHSEIESIIDSLILIKEERGNTESKEIMALRKQVSEAKMEIERLDSESISDNQSKLLEREANKYFLKGLEYHLSDEPEKAIDEYKTAIELKPDMYEAYHNWGIYLGSIAEKKGSKESEELYNQAFEKFKKAIDIKPDKYEVYNSWGTDLGNLAETKNGKESEKLYNKAFEKFKRAIEIKPDNHEGYYNWGIDLGSIAKTRGGEESEKFYLEAIEKFKKAIEIKPDEHRAFNNWGVYLGGIANMKKGKEAEDLYYEAIEKFKKVIDIKPDKHEAYYNWGNDLSNIAKTKETKESEKLYYQAFDKYKKAIKIKPENHVAHYNWGNDLVRLAQTKRGTESEELFSQAFQQFKKAVEINPNLHEGYYNWATNLGNLAKTKEGNEAEELFYQAFEQYRKAVEIKPDLYEAYYNWGSDLGNIARMKEDKDSEELYDQAIEKVKKAIDIKPRYYNLSCLYALKKDKENALEYLKTSLVNNEIEIDFVEKDEDWLHYQKDEDFIALLKTHRK